MLQASSSIPLSFHPISFSQKVGQREELLGDPENEGRSEIPEAMGLPPYSAQGEVVIVHSRSCFLIISKCL